MKIILHWIILSVAIFGTTRIINDITVSPVWVALIVGACLTLFNMFFKPIINILTLPVNMLTLGLFSMVVNGAIFWYLGTGIIKGFEVKTFTAAFVGALVVSLLNWLITKVFRFDL
jgi:putative membrane protein